MFGKILIANRGEIAVRIISTARRMGIATVAVFCDTDRDALHVEMADETVNIGPPPASASYLVIEKIIEACRRTGANAVHPGYGFLSERAAFAEALASAGIAFIGPNPHAIAAMGDKIESKKLAAAAGVSTIPGFLGAIDTEEAAIAAATDVGLPVMLKASAGGGGKGMRVARTLDEVAEGWRLARSEARSSFGDDRLLVEKFIEGPRHIEIQVLGDRHGNVIHLNERECSIQRRNQKIVEEAPSPAVDAKLRAEMGGQAVALAKAVGYDSAGTVEFVMGQDRRFYFLEMNTRLQVEHPVTELITGLDLVEQMIRVAAGEKLPLAQADVPVRGWAIETRLYAEDPYHEFLPSIGRLDRYLPPEEGVRDGATVRIDSGVVEGSEISIYFDPLIAKLVTHAPTREAATAAMADALDRYVVDGIVHNQPFLSAVMAHPRWREGRLSTAFITEEFPAGFDGITPAKEIMIRLSIVAWWVSHRSLREGRCAVRVAGTEVRLAATNVAVGGAVVAVEGDRSFAVSSGWKPGEPLWRGTFDGEAMVVQVRPVVGGVRLAWRGTEMVAKVMRPRVAELASRMPPKKPADLSKALRCPMPGLVVSVSAEPGQKVRAGQPLAVVEAMKMENVLRAARDATVTRVAAKPGEILAVGAIIMEFE